MSLVQSLQRYQLRGQGENPCHVVLVRMVVFRKMVIGTSSGTGRMSQAKKRGSGYGTKSALYLAPANFQLPKGNARPRKSSRPAKWIPRSTSTRSFGKSTVSPSANRLQSGLTI